MPFAFPQEIIVKIFSAFSPQWTDPPWDVQHDPEVTHRQEELAGFAAVCRAWLPCARRILARKPVVRLSWKKCDRFIAFLRSSSRGSPLSSHHPLWSTRHNPFKGVLLLADANVSFTQASLERFLTDIFPYLGAKGSLFIDNLHPSYNFVEIPPVSTLGLRFVDALQRDGSGQPPQIRHLHALSALYLCNAEVNSGLFAGDKGNALVHLGLSQCHLCSRRLLRFRSLPNLESLFLSSVALQPSLVTAFCADLPATVASFAIHRPYFPAEDSNYRAWPAFSRRWDERVDIPDDIALLNPELLFTCAPGPVSPFARQHLDYTKTWDTFHLRPDITPLYIWPWVSDTAFPIEPERIKILMHELGFLAPRWAVDWAAGASLVRSWGDVCDLLEGRSRFSTPLTDYLSRVVGAPVRFHVEKCKPGDSWPAVYICLHPRLEDDKPAAGTVEEVDERSLRRLWRTVGEPLGDRRSVHVVP